MVVSAVTQVCCRPGARCSKRPATGERRCVPALQRLGESRDVKRARDEKVGRAAIPLPMDSADLMLRHTLSNIACL